MDDREWASAAQESLLRGQSVRVRPRGHSMRGRIEDGDVVTLEPCTPDLIAAGDIVLAKVRGWLQVLHQVLRCEPGRFLIGTTAGREDGWVAAEEVFGRVVDVRPDELDTGRPTTSRGAAADGSQG